MSPVQATVYLGLGANLGNRERNITRAVEILGEKVNVDQVSAIYESPAMYVTGQPAFLNAVCRGATELEPLELLAFAQEIERYMGRAGGERNAARPLDVDILFYGGLVTETPKLTIPHPLIDERPFVLAPLAEIDPYLRHPGYRQISLGDAGGAWRAGRDGPVRCRGGLLEGPQTRPPANPPARQRRLACRRLVTQIRRQ